MCRHHPKVDICNVTAPFRALPEGQWGREILAGREVQAVHLVVHFAWNEKWSEV